jgi:hypothetical protein
VACSPVPPGQLIFEIEQRALAVEHHLEVGQTGGVAIACDVERQPGRSRGTRQLLQPPAGIGQRNQRVLDIFQRREHGSPVTLPALFEQGVLHCDVAADAPGVEHRRSDAAEQ